MSSCGIVIFKYAPCELFALLGRAQNAEIDNVQEANASLTVTPIAYRPTGRDSVAPRLRVPAQSKISQAYNRMAVCGKTTYA
jgi:hypothetical protein